MIPALCIWVTVRREQIFNSRTPAFLNIQKQLHFQTLKSEQLKPTETLA